MDGDNTSVEGTRRSSPTNLSTHQRRRVQACTTCRRRKVRCDGAETGCSNCRLSGLTCHFASLGRASRFRRKADDMLRKRIDSLEASTSECLHPSSPADDGREEKLLQTSDQPLISQITRLTYTPSEFIPSGVRYSTISDSLDDSLHGYHGFWLAYYESLLDRGPAQGFNGEFSYSRFKSSAVGERDDQNFIRGWWALLGHLQARPLDSEPVVTFITHNGHVPVQLQPGTPWLSPPSTASSPGQSGDPNELLIARLLEIQWQHQTGNLPLFQANPADQQQLWRDIAHGKARTAYGGSRGVGKPHLTNKTLLTMPLIAAIAVLAQNPGAGDDVRLWLSGGAAAVSSFVAAAIPHNPNTPNGDNWNILKTSLAALSVPLVVMFVRYLGKHLDDRDRILHAILGAILTLGFCGFVAVGGSATDGKWFHFAPLFAIISFGFYFLLLNMRPGARAGAAAAAAAAGAGGGRAVFASRAEARQYDGAAAGSGRRGAGAELGDVWGGVEPRNPFCA